MMTSQKEKSGAISSLCRFGLIRASKQIGKERLVSVSREETGEFLAQPVTEPPREIGIVWIFEAVQDKRTEQHLAACIVGAFLFRQPGLERGALRVEFSQPLFNRLARHVVYLPLPPVRFSVG